mgnify:CR=1 FL=1
MVGGEEERKHENGKRKYENEKMKEAQEVIDEIFSAGGYIVARVIKEMEDRDFRRSRWTAFSLALLAVIVDVIILLNLQHVISLSIAFFVVGFYVGSAAVYALATFFEGFPRVKAIDSLVKDLREKAKLTDKELQEIDKQIKSC